MGKWGYNPTYRGYDSIWGPPCTLRSFLIGSMGREIKKIMQVNCMTSHGSYGFGLGHDQSCCPCLRAGIKSRFYTTICGGLPAMDHSVADGMELPTIEKTTFTPKVNHHFKNGGSF